ncbi:MAG: hypothetical protein IIY52_05295, partial [Solobacterium sp.]|nr:hypothetical protein [Solobacterium sp.]
VFFPECFHIVLLFNNGILPRPACVSLPGKGAGCEKGMDLVQYRYRNRFQRVGPDHIIRKREKTNAFSLSVQ